jgi:hypothetical protein
MLSKKNKPVQEARKSERRKNNRRYISQLTQTDEGGKRKNDRRLQDRREK